MNSLPKLIAYTLGAIFFSLIAYWTIECFRYLSNLNLGV